MVIAEYFCRDKKSVFRLLDDSRIVLVLHPENRIIFIGNYQKDRGLLYLSKTKTNLDKRSWQLAIPQELYDQFNQLGISVVVVEMNDTKRIFCATRDKFDFFGYSDDPERLTLADRQSYRYLDYQHWTEVPTREDALMFGEDQRALEIANKGGLNATK